MAVQKPDPLVDVGVVAFEEVTQSHKPGSALREAPKLVVAKTGNTKSNTEAKEMIQRFMEEQGHDPNDFELRFGGNQDLGQLAIYAPQPKDAGRVKAALYQNSVNFHVGGAFRQYPRLRPSAKVECHIREGKDAKGIPCLIVNIAGGTPVRSTKRKKEEEETKE